MLRLPAGRPRRRQGADDGCLCRFAPMDNESGIAASLGVGLLPILEEEGGVFLQETVQDLGNTFS